MFTNPTTEPSDEIKEAACRLFLIKIINNNDECSKHIREVLEADGSILDKESIVNLIILDWKGRLETLIKTMSNS